MRILFRPEAEKELLEAQAWYESRAKGLGIEFARMAEESIAKASGNPFGHPQMEADYRRVVFRKFPYTLIYLPEGDELLIVSFFHQHRKPGTWLPKQL